MEIWNYSVSASLLEQIDKMLGLVNSEDNDVKEISLIKEPNSQLTTLPVKQVSNEISDSTTKPTHYSIPSVCNAFGSLVYHYYDDAEECEIFGDGTIWRNHLSSKENKRFQRMKRVVNAFKSALSLDNISYTQQIK